MLRAVSTSPAATRLAPAVAAAAFRWAHSFRSAAEMGWSRSQRLNRVAASYEGHQQRRGYSSGDSGSTAMLSNTTSFLRNLHNGAEIFMVGTAHVSKASAHEVRDMIRLVRPASVMVELDPARAARLRAGGAGDSDFLKQMLNTMFAPGGTLGQKVVQSTIPAMYRMLRMLGMDPGAEFKAALEEADRLGARVVYGDRDAQVTLRRLSETMNVQQMLQMATGAGLPEPPPELLEAMSSTGIFGGSSAGLEAKVEGMKSRRTVRAMADYMRQVNPQLAKALIDERDEHMVQQLLKLEGRAVGVVGLAHLDGIERRWEELQLSRQALTAR